MKKLTILLILVLSVSLAAAEKPLSVWLAPATSQQDEYIYGYGYQDASVVVNHRAVMINFKGTLQATGLKPGFTYQAKLVGPGSLASTTEERLANEMIGLSGRWWYNGNRNDAFYYNKKDTFNIIGYLAFDFFTADGNGNANVHIVSDESYHVLWCGPTAYSNSYLYSVDVTQSPFSDYPLKCVLPMLCHADDVIPEIERLGFSALPEGDYPHVRLVLTEESFHQNCGTWSTVLDADTSFSIDASKPLTGGDDTIGLYNPSTAMFYLRETNDTGVADITFGYGPAGAGRIELAGDWDGDGVDTIGLYDPSTATFFLRNSNDTGVADITFHYGPAGLGWILPLVGDWDGDGDDTIGLYDPSTATFYLRDSNDTGVADVTFGYGPPGAGWGPPGTGWIPVIGDWDGDGDDTIGLYNPTTAIFYLRNTNNTGVADITFGYGPPGAGWLPIPIAGDWDGDDVDTIGLYNQSTAMFYLRDSNDTGVADVTFGYGPAGAGWIPIAGDWDGL